VVEGASTITQQLARIVYLTQERSFQRKTKEILLAYKLEQNLDKNQDYRALPESGLSRLWCLRGSRCGLGLFW
jgi:hypothetical protein